MRLIPFEFSAEDTYMLCLTAGRIYIFRGGVLVTNINGTGNDYLAVAAITGAMMSKIRHAQSADTIVFVHQDLTPIKIVRGATHATWTASVITFTNPPFYAFSLATSTPGATLTPSATTGNITLTASSSVFSSGNVHQYINGVASFGRARIIEFVSSTVVKAFVEVSFFDTTAIASGDWNLEGGYEAAWSATRGYPVSVTFHEGRLFFGGSRGGSSM